MRSGCRSIGFLAARASERSSPARRGRAGSTLATASSLYLRGLRARVRSLESYGHAVERSEPSARTAVGLAGVDRDAVARGDVLVTHELPWAPASALDVQIAAPARRRTGLESRTRVRVHLGTAEVMARVLPRLPIEPGGTGHRPAPAGEVRWWRAPRTGSSSAATARSPPSAGGGCSILCRPAAAALWPEGLASRDPAERFRAALVRRREGIQAARAPPAAGPSPRQPPQRWRGPSPLLGCSVSSGSQSRRSRTSASARSGVLREYHRRHSSDAGMPLETLRHSPASRTDVVVEAALERLRPGRSPAANRWRRRAGRFRAPSGRRRLRRSIACRPATARGQPEPPSVPELERSTGRRDLWPCCAWPPPGARSRRWSETGTMPGEALDQLHHGPE